MYNESNINVPFNNSIILFHESPIGENVTCDVKEPSRVTIKRNSDRTILQGVTYINDYEKYLSEMFYFTNSNEINHFLAVNPEIIQYLIESYKEIIDRFLFIIPTIELVKDIELPEWETLYISIPSIFSYEESFLKLNDLLKNWMFYKPKKIKQLVTFGFILNAV